MKLKFFPKIVAVSTLAGLLLFAPSTALALDWVETQPAGDTNDFWNSIASDADGSNLIAASYRLYTSSDGGANWTERQPEGNTTRNWKAVASDSDGSNLIAVYGIPEGDFPAEGRIYTSTDGGANWTERQPAGDVDLEWRAAASDADGSNLIVGVGGDVDGRLYTSSDGGANWTERQPAGDVDAHWISVSSDADGSNLIAAVQNGRLYTSSDGGANWTERQPEGATDQFWSSVASDSDGSNLIAAVTSNGRLYTSSDSGANWTERQPVGDVDRNWSAVASDDDGSYLIAAVFNANGRLYVSSNGGDSWTEEQPAGAANKWWQSVASDSDGSNLFVAINSGRLYTYADLPLEVQSFTPEDGATGVAIDGGSFSIVFSEDVVVGTGNITLYKTSDDSVVEIFDVADGDAVEINGSEVSLSGSEILEYGADYYFLIDEGAFEDVLGVPFTGVSDETIWNFTTELEPTVILDETFVTGGGFDGFGNVVESLTVDQNGKVLIGGWFETYNGSPAFYIARLNTDGTLDETFVTGGGFDSGVYGLTFDADGKILVIGNFTEYNSTPVSRIARLNPDGSLDETFVTGDGFNAAPLTVIVDSNGKILAGGLFTEYNGTPVSRIVRLNADGTLDETFVTGGGFETNVGEINLDTDGKILVGGQFTEYDGTPVSRIARLNTDGTLDETFVTGSGFSDGGQVADIIFDDNEKILIVGEFESYDGEIVGYGIVRLNTDGTLDETFVTGDGFNGFVSEMFLDQEGRVVIVGSFTQFNNSTTPYIVRLNTDGSFDETFLVGDGFSAQARSVALDSEGRILVGGDFSLFRGDDVFRIARLLPPAEEVPPTEEDGNEDDNDGSSTVSGRSKPAGAFSSATTDEEDLKKELMEQIIVLLQELIQKLLAQGQ